MAVANAQGIALDYDERWAAITGLLEKAIGGKASMLQDVEAKRQTEIEVINGAIVEAGSRVGVPTPHNETMVWMVQAAERHYLQAKAGRLRPPPWRRGSRWQWPVSKSFPGVRALDDVSMSVEAGEIRALLGENGAGKSTLGKIVAGVYSRDQGTVLVDGAEVGDDRREGGRRPRHRHRAPGRLAGAAAFGRREHLCRPAADATGSARSTSRVMRERARKALIAAARRRHRPGAEGRRPVAGAGADRRDRQGAVARPAAS